LIRTIDKHYFSLAGKSRFNQDITHARYEFVRLRGC
jgi:hypothetical protein